MLNWPFSKSNEKKKLRNKMRQLRQSISSEEVMRNSLLIAKNLKQAEEYREAKNILFYASKGNEVQTGQIIREAIKDGKKLLLPVTNTQTAELEISEVSDYPKGLVEGPYEIMEPKTKKPFPENEVDAVIVPGLAFSPDGYRIGYGLGYYDKMLSRLKRSRINIRTIGLAYDFQVVEKLPREGHDQPMDAIVTETRVVRLK